MGNRLTVAHPYIIDEYPSDDDGTDDDEDDYFAYESAYEALDQRSDEEDKEDYEGAQKAARVLKEGGGDEGERCGGVKRDDDHEGDGVEMEPLLQKEQISTECSIMASDKLHTSPLDEESPGKFDEHLEPLLAANGSQLEDDDWTSEERKMLQQLEQDLSAFEENESRVVSETDSGSEIQPRRRKRKSSLPRLKPGATFSNSNDGGDSGGGDGGTNHSRESSLTRSSRRAQGSAIPRFCYKATVASPTTTATAAEKSPPKSQSFTEDTQSHVSEIFTSSAKSVSLKASPRCNRCPGGDKVISNESQKLSDQEVKGNGAEAWEVNISDMTGRVRQNKKRSGIPSLWMQSPSKASQQAGDRSPASPSLSTISTSSSSTSPAAKLDLTFDISSTGHMKCEPARRKVFDLKRWLCISRPQYQFSCGISSVVACWNFLFSTLGHGQLNPVSQEDAMRLMGFESPFDNIKFGPFTGNLMLMRWFRKLNSHFGVQGKCYIMYKPCGSNQTAGVTPDLALEKLKCGLQDTASSFIYHCHNHYFCAIGFEETPTFAVEAYSGKISAQSIEQSWILCADTSRKYGPIQSARWEDICQDLNSLSPEYYNIRKTWKGIMTRQKNNKKGGNMHCIICFQRSSTKSSNQTNSNITPTFHLHPPTPDYQPEGNNNNDRTEEEFDRDSLYEEETEEDIESVSSDDDNSFDADSLS